MELIGQIEELIREIEASADPGTKAGVRKLVLTHFSARYSREAADLDREARSVFPETVCGKDGMEVGVAYED